MSRLPARMASRAAPPIARAPPVVAFAVVAALAVVAAVLAGAGDFGSVRSWQQWCLAQRDDLLMWHASAPVAFTIGFLALFVLLCATGLPGSSVLALAAGPCYGWIAGTLLVVVHSLTILRFRALVPSATHGRAFQGLESMKSERKTVQNAYNST